MTILNHKIPLLLTFCLFLSLNIFLQFAICQTNIETFFPTPSPAPVANPPTLPPPISSNVPPPTPPTPPNPSNPPPQPPQPPQPPPWEPPTPPPPSSSRKAIVTAVAVTAAGTLLVSLIALFLCARCTPARRKKKPDTSGAASGAAGGGGSAAFAAARTGGGSGSGMQALPAMEFTKFDGNVKGVIVDENGLDVLYWNKLKGSQRKSVSFNKEVYNNPSIDHRRHQNDDDQTVNFLESNPTQAKQVILQAANSLKIQTIHAPPPPPPPPPPGKKGGGPPPPPPPARKGGVASSSKPPEAPKRTPSGNIVEVGEDVGEGKSDQVKMKPLHWEKVNVNADHSMVWDKIEHGSFQYNGDMMEALFGYVAANRKNTRNETDSNAENNKTDANPVVKIFMLDSKRSQNIAIIVKSLGISRRELITGLKEGKGLNLETLEKLARITPKREEKIEILGFNGDPGRLADAESFLYHLLKAIPSAFTRVNAMLFRFTYDSEMQQLKESLQILNSACTELRSRGIFLKLLEAILKAGNRLNAGTDRGDAKGFNLSALRKLSDYKSSDGKTTLLHFVVHEVVRNEGRRCVMNRNNSLTRSTSQKSSTTSHKLEESQTKEEKEKEFLKLGLPVVGGLSAEFSNVKKSATIDWDTISNTCTSLSNRISQSRQLVLQCGADGAGEFINEMKEFLGEAEGEVEIVKEEEKKVTEFVNKTAQYYQVGGFKDKQPLQLFIIVKDFLGMVDQACIEIARSLQQRKPSVATTSSSSSSPPSPPTPDLLRTRVTFPRLPAHFLSDKSTASDSDDDDDDDDH